MGGFRRWLLSFWFGAIFIFAPKEVEERRRPAPYVELFVNLNTTTARSLTWAICLLACESPALSQSLESEGAPLFNRCAVVSRLFWNLIRPLCPLLALQ